MKLMTFDYHGTPHVGVAAPEGIVDLTRAMERTHPHVRQSHSLLAIIQSGIDIDTLGEESLARLRDAGALDEYVVANPAWLPPILHPPKILGLALNYQEHIDESNLAFFNEPIIFPKYACTMVGHEGEIELPPFPQDVDEEHELAMVVGRDCRHIRPSEAADYVFGWTICNDVSARNRQFERMKMGQPYGYAKNFASFCPLGPWVVTRRELPDVRHLKMSVRVNGKVTRSGDSSSGMIFDPYETLAYCSDYTPMEAGDVISLGTYSGEKRIVEGDVLELEIEGIGVLRNRVVGAKRPWRSFTTETPIGPLVREKP
ncbi:fumarylacetoacetate hydrolase family protein [Paraburkholderia pallida]|uniref:FAA hydrolase family protein n=1 Tax=Paraburkholderia pallida TaxID=2547399 RepID=A0A4P7CY51_9BURK|nr:fumarylacetoacetate hydrolase family protein [Paraburkholderia pallida]QBQ99061.1 FAA hydrolase family protein [Paraburkholderia pallida]